MLIHSGKSKKTAQEDIMNRDATSAGQDRLAEAQNLQKDLQGGLSEIVREHGYVPDELAYKWLDGLKDQQPHEAKLPKTAERYKYDKALGRVVRIR